MKNFDKITKAYALKNAISHEGKVSQGSVISALFNEGLKKQEVKLNTLVYEQELQHQKKSNLLQFSIEDYLEFYVSSYLGYLVTEVKIEDEYVKAFKDYKAFEDSKNYDLIKYIAKYVGYLIRVGELN